jgi:hypothetical protein
VSPWVLKDVRTVLESDGIPAKFVARWMMGGFGWYREARPAIEELTLEVEVLRAQLAYEGGAG